MDPCPQYLWQRQANHHTHIVIELRVTGKGVQLVVDLGDTSVHELAVDAKCPDEKAAQSWQRRKPGSEVGGKVCRVQAALP